MADDNDDTVKITPADLSLQKRVGTGPLDSQKVAKAEVAVENNAVDFKPMARRFLADLKVALDAAKANPSAAKTHKAALTRPVMDLKANGKIFGFPLITTLAGVMLGFLEHIETLDQNALDIVSAHHLTLHAVIEKDLKDETDPKNEALVRELTLACQRYAAKQK